MVLLLAFLFFEILRVPGQIPVSFLFLKKV